jgi:ABC-2 type transport system ATP-binding protein
MHLAAEGRTVFFSSHVIPDVEAICDQVALLQSGKLIGCGPIGKFLAEGSVSTEVGFGGLAESALKKSAVYKKFASIRDIPEGYRAVVSGQEEVNGVLSSLLKLEAQILWVNPLRPSLEDFFKKENT